LKEGQTKENAPHFFYRQEEERGGKRRGKDSLSRRERERVREQDKRKRMRGQVGGQGTGRMDGGKKLGAGADGCQAGSG
jgi:hypothetical protein